MPTKTYAVSIKEWEELTASVAANASELPQLEIQLAALGKMLEEVRTLLNQQALHRANKQQASKRLQTLVTEGERLATTMRGVIKQHYGPRNEKLVEFGLPPFRGRARRVKPPPAPEGPGEPTDPSPGPSSDAAA